jgi:hypothetical protein
MKLEQPGVTARESINGNVVAVNCVPTQAACLGDNAA